MLRALPLLACVAALRPSKEEAKGPKRDPFHEDDMVMQMLRQTDEWCLPGAWHAEYQIRGGELLHLTAKSDTTLINISPEGLTSLSNAGPVYHDMVGEKSNEDWRHFFCDNQDRLETFPDACEFFTNELGKILNSCPVETEQDMAQQARQTLGELRDWWTGHPAGEDGALKAEGQWISDPLRENQQSMRMLHQSQFQCTGPATWDAFYDISHGNLQRGFLALSVTPRTSTITVSAVGLEVLRKAGPAYVSDEMFGEKSNEDWAKLFCDDQYRHEAFPDACHFFKGTTNLRNMCPAKMPPNRLHSQSI